MVLWRRKFRVCGGSLTKRVEALFWIIMRSIQYQLIIFISFLFIYPNLQAQSKISDNLNIAVNYHYGYNLPEYPLFNAIVNDNIQSLDISIYKETFGKNIWEQIYKYPEYGVSFFYSTLGNDKVLGRELVLSSFFKLYFLSFEKLRFYNRLGVGAGYATKKFDTEKNYLNVAVGSNFNIHFNYRLGANFILTEKAKMNAGVSFDHFSNANTSEPNVGVNYATFFGGASYLIGHKNKKQTHEAEPHKKKNSYAIITSIGGKHTRSLAADYFETSSVSFEFLREFWRKIHLGAGADIFYDSSIEHDLKADGRSYNTINSFQTGIHFTQMIVYNKLSLAIQEGFYVGLTEKVENHTMYHRGIIQYQLTDNLLIRMAMKTHWHILNYPELGLGYKF